MKNIFDFATKELSQDAFLCWLFENYNCEDTSLKKASQNIIGEFCALKSNEIILDVKTKLQFFKIDIYAYIKTNFREINLFIEDKVFSGEHDQLDKYNKVIQEKFSGKEFRKIFYKTSLLSSKDFIATQKNGWIAYDIFQICNLFSRFSNSTCIILKQYIDHINNISNAYNTAEMPESDDDYYLLKWVGYFKNIIIPRLNLDKKIYLFDSEVIGTYNYSVMWIKKQFQSCESIPYIELRSRDIHKGESSVTLLCYGVDYKKYRDKLENVANRLKTAPNNIFMSKYRRGDEPKQLGRTIKSKEDLIELLKKCVEDYDFAMREW